MKALGQLRHWLTLEEPDGEPVPDGDGGYRQTWRELDPNRAKASITAASGAERQMASTILPQATYTVNLRYHSGVTTRSRIRWTDRAGSTRYANVIDVNDVDERGMEMILLVTETPA